MWMTGVFGIATKYAESYMSIKYRVKTDKGMMLGGAWYALERGLKMKWLGLCFALFTAFAAFGIGNLVQSNAVASVANENFNVPFAVSGIIMTVITGVVILGGIKRITQISEKVVPVMAVLYILGSIAILIMNHRFVPAAFGEILSHALNIESIGGGLLGYTIREAARFGIARGLFSNESGMGSSPIVAAAAKTRNPAHQALIQMTQTFWDTVVICLLTGLVIVSSALANPDLMDVTNGAFLVNAAFRQIPFIGHIIITFGLISFAYTTILGWEYYGEKGAEYLLGSKVILPYRIFYTCVIFLGATVPLKLVWNTADMLNALMVIPNVIAVILLSGLIYKETKHYVYDGNIEEVDETPVPLRAELAELAKKNKK
jgi:AGCS family alanine or glycine:cation symporter